MPELGVWGDHGCAIIKWQLLRSTYSQVAKDHLFKLLLKYIARSRRDSSRAAALKLHKVKRIQRSKNLRSREQEDNILKQWVFWATTNAYRVEVFTISALRVSQQ